MHCAIGRRRSKLRLYTYYKFCAYSGIFSPERNRT